MTETLQILVGGITLGCLYGLLALGFVVVARSTRVLNLTQGAFVVLGAYLTYAASRTLQLPFPAAVLLAVLVTAGVAVGLEAWIVHRIANTNLYTPILVTFGLLILIPPIVYGAWGTEPLAIGDPWGLAHVRLGPVTVTQRDIAVVVVTVVLLLAFAAFVRYTRIGVAMQATAIDVEAALAQGISDRLVHRLSWAMAGSFGAVSGMFLATAAGGGARPGLEIYALLALPVIILGGIESPLGAVLGGLLMGIIHQFAVATVPEGFGKGFSEVVPYIVMILILLVRPEGLFGMRKVRRV